MNNICYKLMVDVSDPSKFSDFYQKLTKFGDILYINEMFYVWLKDGFTKKKLQNLLNDCEISDFFIKEVDVEKEAKDDKDINFVKVWLKEHYVAEEIKIIEGQKQPQLHEMLKNIQKVASELES